MNRLDRLDALIVEVQRVINDSAVVIMTLSNSHLRDYAESVNDKNLEWLHELRGIRSDLNRAEVPHET